MSGGAAVEVTGLSLAYGSRKALDELNFSVQPGEIFGLLGPNGGGKTSLFRVLATLVPPDSGRAVVFGCDVSREPRQVRRRIGVVFQAQNLDRKLTPAENLRHQGHLYGLRGAPLRARIEQILTQLELLDRKNDLVETLSGGQRRRVELAKGLLHRPGLLLLDEPSTGLDPGARLSLWKHLRSLQAAGGVTILLTTHLLDEAEKCDRLAILDHGRMVASGTPDSLKGEIGGEVILVDTAQPEILRERLRQRFSLDATPLGGKLRFEHPRGHEFIPQLVEAFPGEIQAVRVSKPTLEDVFLHRTGHQFWENGTANEGGR
ncbi:MAG: ABC transporter ATP-binding protein [Acidobacteria bacterium RIFCSPLOWO2_02_FULL_60_20]|nr:MAG: ABC transporter ATP-binding protein [Acidobacteria bacterium RIFCSPLOWO2_02_FULL_60_20]